MGGYFAARDFTKRPEELRKLQVLLRIIESNISYELDYLGDALIKSAGCNNDIISKIFIESAKILNQEELCVSEAFLMAVSKYIKKTSLNKEDESILVDFGKMLGGPDVDSYIKNIRYTVERLRIQEQKAEDIKEVNEKMYKRLGVLSGIAIVILLL